MAKNLLYSSLTLCFLFLLSWQANATHNRAGEITYEQIGPLTIRATITTYSKASSRAADRDSLEICWGDDICQWVIRENGPDFDPQNGIPDGVLIANDTKINIYTAVHNYPALGHYQISMTDPNRNGGVLNVNFPSSDQVPFHLQTSVTLFNQTADGPNNSPILLQPPVDIACTNEVFLHNPNAYDPDGDSLAYRLIVPLQDVNTQVPNYRFPNEIGPPPNSISLDFITGDFRWEFPQAEGEYNIAFYIIQYRDGVAIDTMIRDMQIIVLECDNDPPEIVTISDTCVIAGSLLEFDVVATAPITDIDQRVKLEARGGPFFVDNPAEFTVPSGYQDQPLTGVFRWQTTCDHIENQYYTVVFRAEDVTAEPTPNSAIEVSWESPYACENAADDYFRGFTVWRRERSNGFIPGNCETGLAGRGYTQISTGFTEEIVNGRYYFLDDNVDRGRIYCYRILAHFARRSASGFRYNFVESIPSKEICTQLNRDIPLLLNVDVKTTDVVNGSIFVRWTRPNSIDLDTIRNPGPYRYQLQRAEGITNTGFTDVAGASFMAANFSDPIDTSFTDTFLNTADFPYTYRVAFFVNNETDPIGPPTPASSVFLSIASTDNKNNLSWEEDVPWDNFKYTVFRKNNSGGLDSLATVTEQNYTDDELTNGTEYCYLIRSTGSYGIDSLPSPLINHSQEDCGIPLDTVPPCPPVLTVENICSLGGIVDCMEDLDLENFLNWRNPINICEETDDVVSYKVYYAPSENEELIEIATIDESLDTFFTHSPEGQLAGCYAVTALDTLENESKFSNIVCVDNCPTYELPNVFTPNNDQQNDFFRPRQNCFVNRVDMKIFNRWGQLVFETEDPSIMWDGKNSNGDDLAEGVYYYTCAVFEQRVSGVVQQEDYLQGYIELIRGNE